MTTANLAQLESRPHGAKRRLEAAGRTDVGRQRDHNEDRLLLERANGLFVVADGMGGHNAGEVASALAAVSMKNFFEATASTPMEAPPPETEAAALADGARRLVAAVEKANRDIFEISSTVEKHRGMGSTLVAAHFDDDAKQVHIAHVGDSRCYRIRKGEIVQLTRDHSLISDALAWNPNLTEDQLALLPKNVISRSLGRKGAVEVDIRTEATRPGDVYLLCSDGLSGLVSDREILESLALGSAPDELCDVLVALANDAGGTDNVTVVIIALPNDGTSDAPAPMKAGPPAETPEVTSGEASSDEIAELLALSDSTAEADADHGEAVLICPTCNSEFPAGNAFCVQCGIKVEAP